MSIQLQETASFVVSVEGTRHNARVYLLNTTAYVVNGVHRDFYSRVLQFNDMRPYLVEGKARGERAYLSRLTAYSVEMGVFTPPHALLTSNTNYAVIRRKPWFVGTHTTYIIE